MCATTYADGGKICTSKSDCLGECIVESGKSEFANLPLNVGDEVSGGWLRQRYSRWLYRDYRGRKFVDHICID